MAHLISTDGTPQECIRSLESGADAYFVEPLDLTGFVTVVEALVRRRIREDHADVAGKEQSQKLDAVGRLAGGVAHDFNNLLTVIAGHTNLLIDQLDTTSIRPDLLEIRAAADRAISLTRQLLAFGQRQLLRVAVVDLNDVTHGAIEQIRPSLPGDIDIRLRLSPEPAGVLADASQFVEVIHNLAVNARDAMPHGGILTVETRVVTLTDEYVSTHVAVVPGPYVMLSVGDTGVGMDPDTKRHVFEPFFTTKPFGQAKGLGLAMVYGIVKQLGGYAWVYSERGRGTTFKLYLPCTQRLFEAPASPIRITGDAPPEQKVILLAEDEPGVRKLVAATLKRDGYAVLEASSGEEALTLSARLPSTIDLLVTDVVMPQMSGPELAARIKQSRQDIHVLFMSGFSAEALSMMGTLANDANLLEKPFSATVLRQRVSAILGRGTPSVNPAAC
jgi:signal transduction histidine kinase/CheY-like chemotaxis protein